MSRAWVRRPITITGVAVAAILLLVLSPVWLLVGAASDLPGRRFRLPTIRLLAFALLWSLLELAGINHPDEWNGRPVERMRGRSLVPYLQGEVETVHRPGEPTGFELFGRRAIRDGDWKALWLPKPYGPGAWQLYDLARDPGETDDRAAAEPARLAALIAAWDRYVVETGVVLGASVFET